MTKSKSSMVARDILYLIIVTFIDAVVKSNFPLLSVGWYLFRVVSDNRYLPRGSNESALCITSTANVSVATVADPGGAKGAMAPPGPVKIGHKKDGHQRWPHRFHVSRPPLTRPLDPLLCQMGNTCGNHTAFGFGRDSLNSLNSGKVI